MKKTFKLKSDFKKGAASFYIVAFSTLILLIVATSFAMVIISEIDRTTNEDLSQSAYDSALAGIEDAKLAYYSYQNCVATGQSDANCAKIVDLIENNPSCKMVSEILGRNDGDEGTTIQETNTDNRMQQAYTCVQIRTILEDYRSTLSSSNQMRVIPAKFADSDDTNVNVADKIEKIRISWYTNSGEEYRYTNFLGDKVQFPTISTAPLSVPPTISVAMLQTANDFKMSDFDVTVGDQTDRGMVYLVPTSRSVSNTDTSKSSNWDDGNKTNNIGQEAFLSSNDKTKTNLPYTVSCQSSTETEFACSATITLPRPLSGADGNSVRNPDTFYFIVSLPYGGPATDFSMEFFCENGTKCATSKGSTANGSEAWASNNASGASDISRAYLDSVQIGIDSTGRANDLFRRLETRFDSAADSSYLSLMGPLELQRPNDNSNKSLEKNYTVKSEWNF